MATVLAPIPGIPAALHRAEKDLPFVEFQEGVDFQLLHVDVEAGTWVIRARFQPGVTIQRHKHTGEVFAFTLKGFWKYLEYPEVNVAGSYLYEPALDPYVACAGYEYGGDRCLVRRPRG
ncbi:MAG: 2,4'-dihydroxyacetophenone dioxygenase family protein [Bryobacteraceae bacterium]|nr:2,4'-dihydroxyacetophenone dioxygenase family protein [Bryobacteraceae bacterium]